MSRSSQGEFAPSVVASEKSAMLVKELMPRAKSPGRNCLAVTDSFDALLSEERMRIGMLLTE